MHSREYVRAISFRRQNFVGRQYISVAEKSSYCLAAIQRTETTDVGRLCIQIVDMTARPTILLQCSGCEENDLPEYYI